MNKKKKKKLCSEYANILTYKVQDLIDSFGSGGQFTFNDVEIDFEEILESFLKDLEKK